jgi:hypothetical protein
MFIAHEVVMSRQGVASTKSMESQMLGRMLFPDPGVRHFTGVTTVRGRVWRCRGTGAQGCGRGPHTMNALGRVANNAEESIRHKIRKPKNKCGGSVQYSDEVRS